MKNTERAEIAELWVMLAHHYNKKATKEYVALLVDNLDDVPFAEARAAMRGWVGSKKSHFFPSPADIKQQIRPEIDDDAIANDVAFRVTSAVGDHGYNNARDAERACGEIGWECVRRLGGWVRFCETLNDRQITTVRAQVRDFARGLLVTARAGKLNEAPRFPVREQTKGLEPAGDILAGLLGGLNA